jgi:chaperonin cofactor prefoldin
MPAKKNLAEIKERLEQLHHESQVLYEQHRKLKQESDELWAELKALDQKPKASK